MTGIKNVSQIRESAGVGRTLGFVAGNFNVLHPGHLRLLQFAAELSDQLVVGLLPDNSPGVTISHEVRSESLKALAAVDEVVLLDNGVVEFIAELKPEVVVKGHEFAERDNPEEAVIEGYGGRLVFGSGETQFSSIEIIEREFRNASVVSISVPDGYTDRHGFSPTDLRSDVAKFSDLRVLVIGDLILDNYVTCSPVGMSQEDPTIVVIPITTKQYVGGAGVVSAHAKSLGASVKFITVVGDDHHAQFADDWLSAQGIDATLFCDKTRPTTLKERYRANDKTLLRVNHLRQHPISLSVVKSFVRQVESVLDETDLILFSDFNYGCLPQGLVSAIVGRAREHGVMMAADSQASSQMADISRFKNMELVTPTEREARLALRNDRMGLAALAEALVRTCDTQNAIITMAAEGLLACAKTGGRDGQTLIDRLPAFNTSPKDVAGAGDSLFTTISLARCAGVNIWRSLYLGSIAAAYQVSRVGNAPLSQSDLLAGIEIIEAQFEKSKSRVTSGGENARGSVGGWARHQVTPPN